jgi:hypothetical protein
MPRWEWKPASEPPVVPEGEFCVAVLTRTEGRGDKVGSYDGDEWHFSTGLPGRVPGHWMPLPPGPGEGGR